MCIEESTGKDLISSFATTESTGKELISSFATTFATTGLRTASQTASSVYESLQVAGASLVESLESLEDSQPKFLPDPDLVDLHTRLPAVESTSTPSSF